jgi:glycosyltransferase involved in cell wall biosynthesis
MQNQNNPLVSVIIPFFNSETYLQETIESVLSQTYTDWEILLVDDGSTDKSTEIALDYHSRYPDKIHYLEHDNHSNQGTSATRNMGIKYAKGVYVSFVDADDVWVEKKLEEQVKILEMNKEAAMAYGKTLYWYSWSDDPEDIKRDFIVDYNIELNRIVSPPLLLTRALQSKTVTPNPSNIMVRSEVVRETGGFENSFRGMHDDQVFLAKIYSSKAVYVSDHVWDFYRKHKNSLSYVALKKGKKASSELFYLKWLEKYLAERGIEDNDLWKAIRERKWKYTHPVLFKLRTYRYMLLYKLKDMVITTVRLILPQSIFSDLFKRLRNHEYVPPPGRVRFGDMRRLSPFSAHWGRERGLPIDRHYIENFIALNSHYIKGRILEFGDDRYTMEYYNEKITTADIINLNENTNPKSTIIADIVDAPHISSDTYDCIIFTQTLQFIYEYKKAIQTLYRILAPGGVLLATFPGISQTTGTIWDRYWCWNFTALSAENIFKEFFPEGNLEVSGYGNLICAAGFLYGLSEKELTSEELAYHDPRYEIVITVKAVKP